MLSKKQKQLLTYIYIIFLAIGVLFVRAAIGENSIEVEEKKRDEKSVEVKPAKVYLEIPSQNRTYSIRLRNVDSALDMFEKLRDNADFNYEKTMHTYGVELNHINGTYAKENQKWVLYRNSEDITKTMSEISLADDAEFTLQLEDIMPEAPESENAKHENAK